MKRLEAAGLYLLQESGHLITNEHNEPVKLGKVGTEGYPEEDFEDMDWVRGDIIWEDGDHCYSMEAHDFSEFKVWKQLPIYPIP